MIRHVSIVAGNGHASGRAGSIVAPRQTRIQRVSNVNDNKTGRTVSYVSIITGNSYRK